MKNSEKILELEIKKSDIRREKAKLVLDKCVLLYFLFMVIGALGFIYGYVNSKMLNFLIIASFIVLIIGSMPYITTVAKEEKKIDEFIKNLK
jgi:large-conductance mechanosensitive channel